jgi:DNA-binding transcriptional LysR family regulator
MGYSLDPGQYLLPASPIAPSYSRVAAGDARRRHSAFFCRASDDSPAAGSGRRPNGISSAELRIAFGYASAILVEMELRHLRYFIAVAEALSFTKAADKLRLAQPSLTRQVRNLEEEIGVRLMDRSNNRVVLTEAGKLFLFDSKKVLAMCAESVAAVQRMHRGESSDLNIGYVANIHYGLLPATLGAFRKLYPGVALNLFDMTSAQQLLALDGRKIDLGFVGIRPALSGHALISECVAHDTMLAALPTGHPLAKNAKVKFSELASQFFIGMSAKTHPGAREWLAETCLEAGFAGRILQEADNEPTVIQFVADGLGVALLPEQITGLPHEGVVFRPLSPPLRRDSTIAWRADNTSKPLLDYIQIVKELSRGN